MKCLIKAQCQLQTVIIVALGAGYKFYSQNSFHARKGKRGSMENSLKLKHISRKLFVRYEKVLMFPTLVTLIIVNKDLMSFLSFQDSSTCTLQKHFTVTSWTHQNTFIVTCHSISRNLACGS